MLVWVVLAGIIVLAAWFRFYDIKDFPAGLFPDEAANGEDVQLILGGDLRPFYPRGNGREALFFYLQALSVKALGIGVWQMHIVSGAVGVLTVFAMYFATRVWFGRLSGLLAALLLATSHWHVTLSRTGFRAIMIPLFIAAFTAFVGYTIVSVKKNKRTASYVYAALAGATFFGGFYTYIAYRIMAAVVVGVVAVLLLAALHPKIGFPHLRRYWRHLLLAIVAGGIVIAPLAFYFVQNPDAFVGRAGQVSVFSPDLQRQYGGGTLQGTVMYSLRETLLSFFAGQGDTNWRHNVAGFPLLNPLVGVLFLLGLGWTIHGTVLVAYQVVRGREVHLGMVYPYILLLLVGMLAPVITTAEGMPHGLRSIGLVAPIFILAGTAGSVSLYWLKRRVSNESLRTIGYGAAVGLLIVSILYDGALYFVIARNSSEAYAAYRGDLTVISDYINEYRDKNPDAPRPYLVLDKFSLQTVHFLTSVAAHEYTVGDEPHPDERLHKWEQVDPATSHLTALSGDEIIIFTQSTLPDAERYSETHPNAEVAVLLRSRFGQEIMRGYKLPALNDNGTLAP